MRIKITNSEAIEMIETIEGLGEKVLPVKLSYAIAKNLNGMRENIYHPYKAVLAETYTKYAEKNADGTWKKDEKGNIVFAHQQDLKKELAELLEIENEFDCHEITEESLEQCVTNGYYVPTLKEMIVLARFMS